MPSTRLAASRHTANASGSSLSSDSPLAMRSLNSGVLALSSSSLSAFICGSSALIFLTMPPSCLSRRSLRLPHTAVSKRLNMGGPLWREARPRGKPPGNEKGRQAPLFTATADCSVWVNPAKSMASGHRRADPWSACRDRTPLRADHGSALRGSTLLRPQELPGVHHPPMLPHFEMHMRPGRAPGRPGLGHLLPGADQVAGMHQQARVVGVTGHVTV